MIEPDDAALDQAIRAAMRNRPQPLAIAGLAGRAMVIARGSVAGEATRLVAYHRWSRLATAAATVIIAVIVCIGGMRLKTALTQLVAGDATSTSSSTSWLQDVLGYTSQTSAAAEVAWVAVLMLILVVTFIALLPQRPAVDSVRYWAK